ncbi:MAG: twin-arginine translocase TatA/TatE family subunit [bacterium]
MGFGWTEIAVIALVAIVIFGGSNQLPEMARNIGSAIREFKQAMKSVKPTEDLEIPTDEIETSESDDSPSESTSKEDEQEPTTN